MKKTISAFLSCEYSVFIIKVKNKESNEVKNMKLVNVTNSYKRLVNKQLENTDAYFVKVYSAGNTTVVYTEATQHAEILIVNKKRAVRKTEINEILKYLLKRIPKDKYDHDQISIIELKDVIEISIPISSALVEN